MKYHNGRITEVRVVHPQSNGDGRTRSIRHSTPYTQALEAELALRAEHYDALNDGKVEKSFSHIREVYHAICVAGVVTDRRLLRDLQYTERALWTVLKFLQKRGLIKIGRNKRGIPLISKA